MGALVMRAPFLFAAFAAPVFAVEPAPPTPEESQELLGPGGARISQNDVTLIPEPAMASTPNTLSDEEKAEGFRLLFDGTSLENFRGFKKDHVPDKWQARDGAIVLMEGGAGDILTREQFGDFELRFEFQIAPDGNSGVMWRVTEEGNQTYDSGPEYQILDSHADKGYPQERQKGNISGALYDLVAAKPEPFEGPDAWNEGSIRVEGTKIRLTLNGHVTADVDTSTDEWK
jgi:hypothetical protein